MWHHHLAGFGSKFAQCLEAHCTADRWDIGKGLENVRIADLLAVIE